MGFFSSLKNFFASPQKKDSENEQDNKKIETTKVDSLDNKDLEKNIASIAEDQKNKNEENLNQIDESSSKVALEITKEELPQEDLLAQISHEAQLEAKSLSGKEEPEAKGSLLEDLSLAKKLEQESTEQKEDFKSQGGLLEEISQEAKSE
ncbi:MAG: hypothetical protein IJU40_05930, partial [Desulfovibrionaceae bacterium]|nr:hypothetical protein [Desulfovibrionaceae bacterium]